MNIKDFLLLFKSAKLRPKPAKPKYRVEHVTDGCNHFWPKICRTCGRPAVEVADRDKAVCCDCGFNQ